MGAATVIVVDRRADRLELARAFGADHALSLEELPIAELCEVTGGFGADLVADFVGYPEVIPEGLRMLRGGGTYLEVGSIAPAISSATTRRPTLRASARLVAVSNYSPGRSAKRWRSSSAISGACPSSAPCPTPYPIDQISEAFRQADWLSHGGHPLRISRAPSRARIPPIPATLEPNARTQRRIRVHG